MTGGEAAARIAAQFESPFLRNYTRSKLRTDPLYAAVARRLRGHAHPLVDVGCGIGLMAFYLREEGFEPEIAGIDHDEAKVAAARRIAARYQGLDFRTGDARDPLPAGSSVLLLDVLHYFDDAAQRSILENCARAVPEGGVVVIREGLRDGSWRYRVTWLAEIFARGVRWMKAERLNFPRRETLVAAFPGFVAEVVPLHGATPFNNYLLVFRRSTGGTTNA